MLSDVIQITITLAIGNDSNVDACNSKKNLNPNLTRRHHESVAKSITAFPGGHSDVEPPDPIPNSEVKRVSADGSVGSPHVRVGHCQDLTPKIPVA